MQSFNEMLAVRNGDLPLPHWVLGTDDDLLTDLLPMVFVWLLLGSGTRLIYLVPFIVWASLLATSVLIVRSVAFPPPGRLAGAFAVLVLLGMPTGLLGMSAFWSDFHVATVAVCLLAVLAAAPASGKAFRRRRLVPFAALAFAAAFSDPLADVLLVAPLCLLVAFRFSRAVPGRADEILFALSALGDAASALLASVAVARSGLAYAVLPNVTWSFVSRPAVGDYWDRQLVDAYTGGAVLTDPLVENAGGLALWPWLTDTRRFHPDHRPQFAIIRPHGLFRVTLPAITMTYGKPVSVSEIAGFFFVARLDRVGGR